MSEKKFKIDPGPNPGMPITIIEKPGLPEAPPHEFSVEGNIYCVREYIEGRLNSASDRQSILPGLASIMIDRLSNEIVFSLDISDKYAGSVKGSLKDNPRFLEFELNNPKVFTREQFLSLLRRNRDLLLTPTIIDEVKRVAMTATSNVVDGGDKRGNKEKLFDKTVKADIRETFSIHVSPWLGTPETTFLLDLCMEVAENKIVFWLECNGLEGILKKMADQIIDQEKIFYKEQLILVMEK